MAAYGIPETEIARVLKIDPKTLRKHYQDELELGHVKANAQVAGFLFNSAKNGNVSAQIFWLKTRARWNEPPAQHHHVAAVATIDLASVAEDEVDHLRSIFAQLTPRDNEILEAIANSDADDGTVLETLRGSNRRGAIRHPVSRTVNPPITDS